MSTFGDLLPIVRANLGGRDDPDADIQIMFAMNFVQKILAASREWKELQAQASPNTVINQYAYTEAQLSLVNPQRVYQITLNNGTRWLPPMQQKSEIQWRKDCAPYLLSNKRYPGEFSIFGGYFNFFPVPDKAYALLIEYYKKVTPITGVNSTISYEDKDELIIALTTAVGWLSSGEESLFAKWLAFATPLISSFNIDSNRIMNFISPGNRKNSHHSPWIDPFVRK